MQKLIASDFDGTINCGGDSIPMNALAVKRWREAGHLFGIVTGRSTKIQNELKERDFPFDFVLANNGTTCIKDGKLEYCETNDISLVPEIIDFVSKNGAGYFGLIGLDYDIGFNVSDIPADITEHEPFTQVSVICGSTEDAVRISALINEHFDNILTSFPNGQFIDIVKYGISKAEGIRRIAALYGIDYENTYSVGDNYNDIVMLDAFKSYTVEGAVEEAKKHASCGVKPSVADMIDELLSE